VEGGGRGVEAALPEARIGWPWVWCCVHHGGRDRRADEGGCGSGADGGGGLRCCALCLNHAPPPFTAASQEGARPRGLRRRSSHAILRPGGGGALDTRSWWLKRAGGARLTEWATEWFTTASNTTFSPTMLRADVSTYPTAPNSRAAASPSSGDTTSGLGAVMSRLSTLVPTRRMGAPAGLNRRTSGSQMVRMLASVVRLREMRGGGEGRGGGEMGRRRVSRQAQRRERPVGSTMWWTRERGGGGGVL
jgi:hypothetical protein